MKFLIPHISLFGLPVVWTMRLAKRCGFDGVEILLTPFTRRRVEVYRRLAEELGLVTHFHQSWSLDENPTHFHNKVLNALGYLPRSGYTLDEHIPESVKEPVVVYADRFREARGHANWWLQTVAVFEKSSLGLRYKLPYPDFPRVAREGSFSVVFDTQHVLEYMANVNGVEYLSHTRAALLEMLKEAWKYFGPSVKEIHLNDCNPGLGHDAGRNVFLGDGILPLKEFCAFVMASGWDGFVTTEVAFGHLKYSAERLIELNRRARALFTK